MTLKKPFSWEHWYNKILLIWELLLEIILLPLKFLKQFLGLVTMQSTAIGKEISKAKVQCTKIKVLKVHFFASIF